MSTLQTIRWGVAAALFGSAATSQAPEPLETRVATALDRARPALEHHLRRTEGDSLTLVCLAATHYGLSPTTEPFRAAMSRLSRLDLTNVYALSIRLMLMAEMPDYPDRERAARRDLGRLLARQSGTRGFRYRVDPPDWDYSVTQYAVLGLRAAHALQLEIPEALWGGVAAAAIRGADSYGGFGYTPNQPPTVAMTVAGIAILEVCSARLAAQGRGVQKIDRALARAWRWMDRQAAQIDPGTGSINHYFLYGLERAAILSNRDQVGGVDWYAGGAGQLLAAQARAGGFFTTPELAKRAGGRAGYGDPINTSFAILFLKRAFRRELTPRGPVTQAASVFCHALAPDADLATVRGAAKADARRGLPAVPDLLRALRSEHSTRRRAAARALILISEQDFGYHPLRSAEANAAPLRAAERWYLQQRDERR